MCTWNFDIDWVIFLYFTGFFLFLELVVYLITRNSVLKTKKNLDLNIENLLFLNWNFVFTIMIYNIFYEFC